MNHTEGVLAFWRDMLCSQRPVSRWVGCLLYLQGIVFREQICLDDDTCCQAGVEALDQNCYPIQSV